MPEKSGVMKWSYFKIAASTASTDKQGRRTKNKQWYHFRELQWKGYFWINICIVFFFQILHDYPPLLYVFTAIFNLKDLILEYLIVICMIQCKWLLSLRFCKYLLLLQLIKDFYFLKQGMAKCVEKINRLTSTIKAQKYYYSYQLGKPVFLKVKRAP